MTDRYQRLMAEFENARKRMDKEKGQMFDIGAKSVLEKLLPVVDNFERGLGALNDEDKEDPFVQGVEKIYQQLMTVLTDVGVSPIDATGKEFNPDLHNAVMHVEDEDLPDNVVAEEFQKGYMYKDSVLRYSMVKVAN
jgi:molecular chaperone GrpE